MERVIYNHVLSLDNSNLSYTPGACLGPPWADLGNAEYVELSAASQVRNS
jgi:hypothetical protein